MTESQFVALAWILVGFAVLASVVGVIVIAGSWWESRHPDPDLEDEYLVPTPGREILPDQTPVGECGSCGRDLLASDPVCTLAKIIDDPIAGGSASSAMFHVEHCPDTGPDHEHGTTTVRVVSAP